MEAFLGLTEILAKAFAPRPESDQAASGADSPVRAAIDSRFDIPRRHVRLLDDSAFGVGVVCEDHALHAAEVGSLIALRDADGPPPLLCEVARRSGPGGPGTPPAQLGLRVLSRHPGKLAVQMAGSAKRLDALYLPGEDRSGYQDSLLVSQTDFTPGGELKVTLTDRAFVLRMSRVRYHGAGWQLVGFEVIEETAGEAASPGAPA